MIKIDIMKFLLFERHLFKWNCFMFQFNERKSQFIALSFEFLENRPYLIGNLGHV